MAKLNFKVVGGTDAEPQAAKVRTWIVPCILAGLPVAGLIAWALHKHPPSHDNLMFFAFVGLVVWWVIHKVRVRSTLNQIPVTGRVIVEHRKVGLWW